jgi:hypothetical protein
MMTNYLHQDEYADHVRGGHSLRGHRDLIQGEKFEGMGDRRIGFVDSMNLLFLIQMATTVRHVII